MAKGGTGGYHGLACSEQNHSSLLVRLNNGHRRKTQFYKDPHTLLKDLLQCDHKHVNKRNYLLPDQKYKYM